MKILAKVDWLILAFALAVCLAASNWPQPAAPTSANDAATATDPVLAAFEREFNHQPAEPSPVRRDSIDDDVLYRRMNPIHWSQADMRHTDIATGDLHEEP